jgi:hypothetical protein
VLVVYSTCVLLSFATSLRVLDSLGNVVWRLWRSESSFWYLMLSSFLELVFCICCTGCAGSVWI